MAIPHHVSLFVSDMGNENSSPHYFFERRNPESSSWSKRNSNERNTKSPTCTIRRPRSPSKRDESICFLFNRKKKCATARQNQFTYTYIYIICLYPYTLMNTGKYSHSTVLVYLFSSRPALLVPSYPLLSVYLLPFLSFMKARSLAHGQKQTCE